MVPFYGPKIWVHHRYIYFGGSTPPQFARDMNAALMLTEEMRIEGYNTEIGNGTNGSWECHFCKYDSSSGERVRTASYLGFADTLPEAICKAYLLAMTS
jgi:hypothetical protein